MGATVRELVAPAELANYTPNLAGKPINDKKNGLHDPVKCSSYLVYPREDVTKMPLLFLGFARTFFRHRIHLKSTGQLPV